MTKFVTHFAMAAILAWPAVPGGAATVPQDSADKYYFSRPNMQSNIVGVVMGDPPAYSLPRSEDIAWLREAWCERAALAQENPAWTGLVDVVTLEPKFGRWTIEHTNDFARYVTAAEPTGDGGLSTNIVVGYETVTNKGSGLDSAHIVAVDPSSGVAALVVNTNNYFGGFLSTNDHEYISSARSEEYDPSTNEIFVVEISEKRVMVPAWSNLTEYVRMRMTNGTESVWTNSWAQFAPTQVVVIATNRRHVAKYATGEWIFTNKLARGYDLAPPGKIRGILDTAAITNQYAYLRGAYRLARSAVTTNAMLDGKISYYESQQGQTPQVYPYGEYAFPYLQMSASAQQVAGYTNYYDGSDLKWGRYDESFKANETVYTESGPQTYFLRAPVLAAIPDGTLRVSKTRLFGLTYADYSAFSISETTPDDGNWKGWSTNMSWQGVMPLGEVTLLTDGESIYFQRSMPQSELGVIWQSTSAPESLPVSHTWTPGIQYPLPEPSHGEFPGSETNSSTRSYSRFEVGISALYMLIDFSPISSLPGWN